MAEKTLLKRITADPNVFGGKQIIRGMRTSVEMILALLARGATHRELLEDYPHPEEEDILTCLVFASGECQGAGRGGGWSGFRAW